MLPRQRRLAGLPHHHQLMQITAHYRVSFECDDWVNRSFSFDASPGLIGDLETRGGQSAESVVRGSEEFNDAYEWFWGDLEDELDKILEDIEKSWTEEAEELKYKPDFDRDRHAVSLQNRLEDFHSYPMMGDCCLSFSASNTTAIQRDPQEGIESASTGG